MILETPVFTIEAALNAASSGVHRLELCSGFHEGGLTPGAGAAGYVKSQVNIPVFVMIRPRGGDFVYAGDEILVMREEIYILKNIGADGFVFGALTPDGHVDKDTCSSLIEAAEGLPCTFHRAFDMAADLDRSLEDIIECGFQRILTSGGKPNVEAGLETIKQLLHQAGNRITIMPGGGMKTEFIKPLAETGYLKEIHASCKCRRPSESKIRKEIEGLHSDEPGVLTVDKNQVEVFLAEMENYS
ncbi:MAG: copper homeostasis protein CutC [Balneolaceae bacterium]